MSRNFSFARVAQHTRSSIGQSERHIERKNETYENMNVDLSRTYMNIHFKSCGDLTYPELGSPLTLPGCGELCREIPARSVIGCAAEAYLRRGKSEDGAFRQLFLDGTAR